MLKIPRNLRKNLREWTKYGVKRNVTKATVTLYLLRLIHRFCGIYQEGIIFDVVSFKCITACVMK